MANNVKFLSGAEESLRNKEKPVAKIPGQVYFAINNDNNNGSIYFDDKDKRIRMTARADNLNFVIGTGETVGQWKGSLVGTGITNLYDGLQINYYVNIAGNPSGTTSLDLILDDADLKADKINTVNRSYVLRHQGKEIGADFVEGTIILLTYYNNKWYSNGNYDITPISNGTINRIYEATIYGENEVQV